MFLVGGITMTATAMAAALAVAGFHRAALALETPLRTALVLTMLLGGATVLWPYGTSFYSEAWQAAALCDRSHSMRDRITTAIALSAGIALATGIHVGRSPRLTISDVGFTGARPCARSRR